MIIANEKVTSSTTNIGSVVKAKINSSARIFSFFSTQVYSKPLIAIVRELTANGIDGQKMAGRGDVPMTITLPTDFTPYMVFRDWGVGMSHEFMTGDPGFMSYTESTKGDSNEQIGGFGVGSKAPLSYTEQFSIKSFQNGIVNIYSVFKDEDDCPALAHLGQSETDEPDGIEISFPVEGVDVNKFREAAYSALTYFNPLPELKNAAEQVEGPQYSVRTPTWGFRKDATFSQVIMGGIAYPITKGMVGGVDQFLDYGIDFYVPIGSCSISLSRESLNYDEATIRVIKSLVDAVRPDIEKHVASMFENCATRWEAESLFLDMSTRTGNPHRQQMVRQFGIYKGTKLTGRVRPISADKVHLAQVTSSRYNKSNYTYWTEGTNTPTMRAWLHDVTPRDISVVLIDDGPNKPILRMRNYLQNNDISNKGVAIFRTLNGVTWSKMDWARFLVKLGRPNFKFLSEIEPMVVTRGPSVARVKRICAYTTTGSLNSPRSASAEWVDKLPDTGGYYIKMTAFNVDEGQITSNELNASGIKPGELFYFNKQDFIDADIESNPLWKPAKVAYDTKVSTYKSLNRNLPLASAFYALLQQRNSYNSPCKEAFLINVIDLHGIKLPSRGPLYQLVKMHNLIKDQLNYQDHLMRELLEVKCLKEVETLTNLLKSVAETYPELWKLVGRDRRANTDLITVYNKLIS